MFQRLLRTNSDYGLFIIRIVLGLVILPHGAQKLLGWFGGYGFDGTMQYFASLGIPSLFGVLAIAAEFFGSIGLIIGLLTRVAAFGVGSVMLVAAVMVHLPNGFFMNWFGNQPGEGIEYFLVMVAVALVLVIKGGGTCSFDERISRLEAPPTAAQASMSRL